MKLSLARTEEYDNWLCVGRVRHDPAPMKPRESWRPCRPGGSTVSLTLIRPPFRALGIRLGVEVAKNGGQWWEKRRWIHGRGRDID